MGTSGKRGPSSCFGRTGRGDSGGLVPGLTPTVAERGGNKGRDGVGGGCICVSSNSGEECICGASTVITGCRGDIVTDTVLRPSCFGVVIN